MDCTESRELFSSLHDGELDGVRRAELEVHLESCPSCRSEFAELRRLSEATQRLPNPKPPIDLWDRILSSLHDGQMMQQQANEPATGTSVSLTTRLPRRARYAILAVASVLLVGFGMMWRNWESNHHVHDHDPLAEYVVQFGSNPADAQRKLTVRYAGQAVSADRAAQLVGYRPASIQTPPDGFTVDAHYVLDMPCCKCVEAIWRRSDDSYVAIFEHNAEPGDWFQNHPSVHISCAGKACHVSEVGDLLAASWRRERNTLTVVGLRDVEELPTLVAALN